MLTPGRTSAVVKTSRSGVQSRRTMKNQSIPTDRLSIISSLIILNYALMPFIYSPRIPIQLSLFGILFDLSIKYSDLMVISAAAFAAIGTYWLLFDHPLINKSNSIIHLILPTLIAGVMSIPLNVINIGPAWWAVFALESILIILTLIAEYYSIDPNHSLFALSKIILIPLAISLILLLSISARSAGYRLYIETAVLGVAFGAISVRLNALTHSGEKRAKTLSSTYLFIQILVVCHYLPLTSIPFGLVLTGWATFLIGISLADDLEKNFSATLRNAAFYAIPFLIGAILFLFV